MSHNPSTGDNFPCSGVCHSVALSFHPGQDKADNFDPVDLSWIDVANGGLTEILSIGDTFLSHPNNMNKKNRRYWCNFHILPTMPELMVEMRAYNKVVCWALRKLLGSAEDPTTWGMVNLITTFPGGL